MCFYTSQTKEAVELENRFKAKFSDITFFKPTAYYNGFSFPQTPLIADKNKDIIDFFYWGLIPFWAKEIDIRNNTLNAKIETLEEKPSFRNCIKNRCLILVDGFFEWQWLDEKGKKKQKFFISKPDNSLFALAGLWSEWINKETGEILKTYTIVTTESDDFMAKIHNSKKRMPIILSEKQEIQWLGGLSTKDFVHPQIKLKAVRL